LKVEFSQSNASVGADTLCGLRRGAANYIPVVDGRGKLDRFILERMDSNHSVGDIAEAVTTHFSKEFPSWEDALEVVGEISRRYSA
jgi:hypothetical protein